VVAVCYRGTDAQVAAQMAPCADAAGGGVREIDCVGSVTVAFDRPRLRPNRRQPSLKIGGQSKAQGFTDESRQGFAYSLGHRIW